MAKYRVQTTGGTYEIETADAPAQAQPDAFEKAVNYHTGNNLIDAPLGLLQGAAKGAASTGVGIGAIARKVAGLPPLPADTFKADTEAAGIGQGTGKFLEQAAEFAVPGGAVGKATKGLGLLARAGAQAGVAGSVGAAQSGGDPTATAVSAGLGGAGELAGPALGKAKQLFGNRAPTLQNYAESFGNATPKQKEKISAAIDLLKADGIKPTGDIHEMQSAIKGRVQDLSGAYNAVDPAVKAREVPAQDVINKLRAQQAAYSQKGVVLDDAAHNAIESQIQKVEAMGKAGGGKVDVNDLIKLKQTANNKTSFSSADWEHEVWGKVGNVYRSTANQVAPEMKPLNQAWQKYADLEKEIDKNVLQGKGTTKSGLDALLNRAASHGVGASVGASIGGAVGGPVGAGVGAAVGGIAGPKIAKTAQQMLQNAIDSGAFSGLSKSGQRLAVAAAKVGDMKTLNRLLGGAGQEIAREGATQTQ
jgi:hypothetical protein